MADSISESAAELGKRVRELASEMAGFTSSANSASGAASDVANSLSQLAGGAINFSKQISNGTDTFSKFNGAIEQLSDGTSDLIFAIGKGNPLMVGLALFAKALGSIVGTVNENDDTLAGSYDKLAAFGAATSLTTESLRAAAIAAEFPVQNKLIETITKNMSGISTDLLGLATTSGEGVKKFMLISSVGQDVYDKFNKLGVSQDKLNQYQAAYVSQQVKLGAARGKREEDLKKESLAYAENLIELSAITGKSADQIKESQKNDLDDVAYALHARKLAQTEAGKLQLQREKEMLERAEQIGGKDARKAILKVAATGTIVGEEASSLGTSLAMGKDDIVTLTQQMQKGQITSDQFAKRMQTAQKRQLDSLGNAANLMDANTLKGMHVNQDSLKGQSQVIEDGTQDKVKKDIASAKDRRDGIKDTQNKLRREGKDISSAIDEFVSMISGTVHTVMTGLMHALTAFSKGMIEFLKRPEIQKLTGVKIDQSVNAMFMSTSELTQRNNEITARMKEVEEYNKQSLLEQAVTAVKNPSKVVSTGEKAALIEEQKAIKQALATRAADVKASTPNANAPAATGNTATTTTAPAPPATQASGAAPPPTATPGSHADGGVARPPFSGFSGALGGTEATIPLPSGENIPAKIKMPSDLTTNRDSLLGSSDTVQGLMTQYTSNLGGGTQPASTTSTQPNTGNNIFEMVSSRMDDLLELMTKNNSLQTELLQLSKR